MYTIYFAEDFYGNYYLTDDRDNLPPDIIFFKEIIIPLQDKKNLDRTMLLEISNLSEIHSLTEEY